jgi:CRISPR/Cas system CSM-associated protein Csm3 (group 7 of RAMP superfamily)
MHSVTRNELRLDFSIISVSPLSIQNKGETPQFVRALHPDGDELSIYVPSSTLKGALRSTSEQILRGDGIPACDPEHPCAERESVKQAKDGPTLYRTLCAACRLFGSRLMRSHLTVTDSFPAIPDLTTQQDTANGVDSVLGETFYGTLTLTNFERWQVGLLMLALTRINIADVRLGRRRSAGLGQVLIRYGALSLVYPGFPPDARQKQAIQTRLHGVGQFMGPNNPYGYVYPDVAEIPDLPEQAVFESGLGYSALVISSDEPEAAHGLIDHVLTRQAIPWGTYVRAQAQSQVSGNTIP